MSWVDFRWCAAVCGVVWASSSGCGRTSLDALAPVDEAMGGGGVTGRVDDGGKSGALGRGAQDAGPAGTFPGSDGGVATAGTASGGTASGGTVNGGTVNGGTSAFGGSDVELAGQGGMDNPTGCLLPPGGCAGPSEPECAGVRVACRGDVLDHGIVWGTAATQLKDIATASDGRIAVVGYFQGLLNVEAGTLPAVSNGDDGFVLVFDSEQKLLWHHVFGGEGAQAVTGVAFMPAGDVIVQGMQDPDPVASAERPEGLAVLTRLDRQGEIVWTFPVGDGETYPGQVGVARDGAITLVGGFRTRFAYQELAQDVEGYASYVLHVDSDGKPGWLDSFAPLDWKGAAAQKLEVDDEDNLVVLGYGVRQDNHMAGYVQKLSPEGEPRFLRELHATEHLEAGALAVDDERQVLIGGRFRGELPLGTDTLKTDRPYVDDLWIAELSPDGRWIEALRIAGADDGTSQLTALTVDALGNLIAGESSYGSVTLRKLRASGRPVWTRRFDTVAPVDLDLARGDDDNIWFAGSFAKSLDMGGDVVTAPADDSIFLLEVSP